MSRTSVAWQCDERLRVDVKADVPLPLRVGSVALDAKLDGSKAAEGLAIRAWCKHNVTATDTMYGSVGPTGDKS